MKAANTPPQRTYSIYEAKTRLSEIIRAVKRRARITITDRGVPVARVVAWTPPQESTLEQRLAELVASGSVLPAEQWTGELTRIARKPGALSRFLTSRSDE